MFRPSVVPPRLQAHSYRWLIVSRNIQKLTNMEVPDLYKNLNYSEKMSREVGLITQAQQANGSFEVPRSYEDAARWLMSRNCLVIEGYDDNSLLCYLPEDVNGDRLIDSFKYWGDQFDRLEEVNRRLREARLEITMNDYSVSVAPPEADADATDWELYATQLELEIIKADARKTVDGLAKIKAQASAVKPSPEVPLKKHGKNDAVVLAVCFIVVVLIIFMIISCFN